MRNLRERFVLQELDRMDNGTIAQLNAIKQTVFILLWSREHTAETYVA